MDTNKFDFAILITCKIVGPEYSNGNWFLDIIAAKNADYVIHKKCSPT